MPPRAGFILTMKFRQLQTVVRPYLQLYCLRQKQYLQHYPVYFFYYHIILYISFIIIESWALIGYTYNNICPENKQTCPKLTNT